MIKRECKVKLLDEVYVQLVGLSDDHLRHFMDKYSILTDNYFFNPRYKLGVWDGKISFFQITGKTYLYLLEEILPQLSRFGYKVSLEDQRSTNVDLPSKITSQIFSHVNHLDTGEPITIRDYQVEAVNSLIAAGSGVCLAGTGSGKTLCCAALVAAYSALGIRSLTIVPDGGLIRQTKAEYLNCGLDAGEYSGTSKDVDHQHVVSTWQSLKNNPLMVNLFQMVIVDECHGLRGNVLQSILTKHAATIPYRFGFTGTLPKSATERMAVHVAVGPVRYEMPASTLIEMGVLAKLHIDVVQLEEDLQTEFQEYLAEEEAMTIRSKPPTYTEFKDGYFPDYKAEKSYIHRKEERIEWIAQFIMAKQSSGKGNVMCLVDSISFGRQLAAAIPGAVFVNGQDVKTPKARSAVYEMFKDRNDFVMIATVHIAGTGISINRIFNLIFIDIGKSFTRVVQGIGRGLRKGHDKDSVVCTDLCSDLKYGKRHLATRIAYYKESKYPFKKHKVDYMKMMTIDDRI